MAAASERRTKTAGMSGPLTGYRIIEIAGIGPGPFAAMMLADMGAEVIRVDRAQAVRGPAPDTAHWDVLLRGRRNIALDLKHPDGVATLLDLVAGADALIEGFRPGVMERLGIGPAECHARNPKLVYGRMTGWGQEGRKPESSNQRAHKAGLPSNAASASAAGSRLFKRRAAWGEPTAIKGESIRRSASRPRQLPLP